MKRLLVIAGLLALCAYPVKATTFYSGTGAYQTNSGSVEVPTDALMCAQWAAAYGSGNFTYSYGPMGNYLLNGAFDESINRNGSLPAGTYSYFQQVLGDGHSNLLIVW